MDNELFDDLLNSVQDMAKHARGEPVQNIQITEIPEIDVRALRERVGVSQIVFAAMIGVSKRTLENWEQHRVTPSGPAKALLKIFDVDPEGAMRALHA